MQDINDRKEAELALNAIISGTASATGGDFFQSLVSHLATALNAKIVLIAKCLDHPPTRNRSLAFWNTNKICKNFDFEIKNISSEKEISEEFIYFSDCIHEMCPDNNDLVKFQDDHFMALPLKDSSVRVIGYLVMLDDKLITKDSKKMSILQVFATRGGAELERQRSEEALGASEERLRTIIENAPEAIVLFDMNTQKFADVNENVSKMFGLNRDRLLSIGPFELSPATQPDGRDSTAAAMEKLKEARSGLNPVFEWTHRTHLGKNFPCEVRLVSIELGGKQLIQGSLTDISERKRVEKELETYRHQLEVQVQKRTEQLEAAQKELVVKEKLATLGQLIAIVSHELRNPLGTIRSSMYSIDQRIRDKNLGVENALNRVERNILRCDRIIEELLDFTRIKEPKLDSTEINDWINKLLDEYAVPDDISITRNLDSGLNVEFDRELFRRCLINLIDNACQAFNQNGNTEPSPGPKKISIQTLKKENRVEIAIEDNGRGISPDFLEKIFEPLYSTKNFGVGLGLPIVKQILIQHDGGIEIASEIGKGTEAKIWLPL